MASFTASSFSLSSSFCSINHNQVSFPSFLFTLHLSFLDFLFLRLYVCLVVMHCFRFKVMILFLTLGDVVFDIILPSNWVYWYGMGVFDGSRTTKFFNCKSVFIDYMYKIELFSLGHRVLQLGRLLMFIIYLFFLYADLCW